MNSGLVKRFSEVEGKPSTTFLAKSSSENTKCTVLSSGEKVTFTGVSLVRVILLARKRGENVNLFFKFLSTCYLVWEWP